MWQNEFKNKESKKFKELSGQIEREFSDHSSFNQSREILNWHVSRLQQNNSEVIINLRVRTTAHMSPDQLLTMVLESNMNNTVIDAKELYFATTSIFPESSTLFLAHLSYSVNLQTSLQTLDAPTTQTTSPMLTIPRWTTTHFSLKTASAMSLISPSFSEKFMTSSEVYVIEEKPATEELTEIVPTEKSPSKTQPTVPESSIKFVVSKKVGSYNYIPEMEDLSSSVNLQTSSQTLDAPTTQTTSPMLTIPRWTTTHFSLKTASAMSLISPSFSEKFMTSSEVYVIEEKPATEELTEIVPTEKSPSKTQPTVPESSIKFVVSMKVGSYNYTPEMADPESAVFKKVAKEIENTLYEELCRKKLLDCIAVEVFKLEKGSVIVSYNVHMASSTNYKQSHVNNVITDSANSGQLGRLKVSDVEVKKGDKEEEQNDSSSSRVFVYVLCGVGALLVIASIIAATSKVRKHTICCHPI